VTGDGGKVANSFLNPPLETLKNERHNWPVGNRLWTMDKVDRGN
jgi:hypothetical protein